MKAQVRKANIHDLSFLVNFTAEEAKEAEGIKKIPSTLKKGIKAAIQDNSKSIYWVIVDESDKPFGNVSALKEWSDWNAGYYWWIQSMYISPEYRGKGFINLLVDEVKKEMDKENGLELRLYVHNSNKTAIRAYKKIGFTKTSYVIMKI
jgi:ribosomal protein S18 acetylase RimI-like enzyme